MSGRSKEGRQYGFDVQPLPTLSRLDGSQGIGAIRNLWTELFSNRGVAVLNDAALAMLVGIGRPQLQQLKAEGVSIKISGTPQEWRVQFSQVGSGRGRSPKQEYEHLFSQLAGRMANNELNMELFTQDQNPLVLLFGLLPDSIQEELKAGGKDPGDLYRQNPDL
jgi:hypothetical protein